MRIKDKKMEISYEDTHRFFLKGLKNIMRRIHTL